MTDLISAGANRIPQPVGYLGSDLIYASQNLILRWTNLGVTESWELESQVNAVVGEGTFVLSGTQDGKVYLLSADSLIEILQLESSITCLAVNNNSIAVGTSDGYVRKFTLAHDLKTLREDDILKIGPRFYPLTLAIYGDILAVAGTSGSVYLESEGALTEMQGHENWVRSLDFREHEGNILLASGSQDRYIRLWSIKPIEKSASDSASELATKVHKFGRYCAAFDALLIGHDDWVVSVKWDHDLFRLLSASSDSSLIVWSPGDDTTHFSSVDGDDLWTPQVRLGDISIMGASTATGASGGFWTALWTDEHVATISKTGSWRLWSTKDWNPIPGISGHTKAVTDVAWFGDRLLSTSLDQTTRLWAQVHSTDVSKTGMNENSSSFYEVSRPQIHGYDMLGVATVDNQRFVSAGDEKTLRVFTIPKTVDTLLTTIGDGLALDRPQEASLPLSAAVPALGLSNKIQSEEEAPELESTHIPREDQLQRLTLWPEVEKLYGHGYEMNCLDVSPTGEFIASCCKANSTKHAVVRLFTTDNWRQIEPLAGHTLTVTRVRFSPNGKFLLSVSRDRQWILFNLEEMSTVVAKPKAHSRIIWDCAWLQNNRFLTGSRDKTVRLWSLDGELIRTETFDHAVTALDADQTTGNVVVGLENGAIYLFDGNFKQLSLGEIRGDGRVNRVLFGQSHLAVASDSLRIYRI